MSDFNDLTPYQKNQLIQTDLFNLPGENDNIFVEYANRFKEIEILDQKRKEIIRQMDFEKRIIRANIEYLKKSKISKENYPVYLSENSKFSYDDFTNYIEQYLNYIN